MKAVILAGGEGRRLRPLTERMPKPLLPLPDRPVIDCILYRLAKAGITEAAVTLGYLAPLIREALGDSRHGISLTYFEEKVARGTAGSVKNAEAFLDEDFIVLCGDGVFDFDLSACMEAHKKADSDVTLVLTRHRRPREYGVVLCDPADRVVRFLEKPDWTQTFSDTVNTGIYLCKRKILSYIPQNSKQDFASDIFPRLLRDGFSLQGYTAKGYWCDIGSPSSYYRCVRDALAGKIEDIPFAENRRNLYKAGSGYYYQADGVLRGEDTVVTAGSVISEGCRLLKGSMVDSAILFPNVTLGEDSRVDCAILSEGVSVGREVRIHEGVVLGEKCEIESFCSLPSGTSYPAGTRLKFCGQRAFSDQKEELFDIDSIPLTLSAERAIKIGRAAALASDEDQVYIMHGPGSEETLLANEVASGVMLAGKNARMLGEGNEAMAVFAATAFHTPLLMHLSGSDGQFKALLLDGYGLPLSNIQRRRTEQIFDSPFPETKVGKTERVDGLRELYLHALISSGKALAGETVYIAANRAGDILADALTTLSASVRRGECDENETLCWHIGDDGKSVRLKRGNSYVDFEHLLAVILLEEAKKGTRSFALPYLAPRIYENILSPYHAVVYRYLSVAGEHENEARALSSTQRYLQDGSAATIALLGYFTEKDGFHSEKLLDAIDALPAFRTVEETFRPTSGDEKKAALLARLSLAGGKGREGIAFSTESGFVSVTPRKNGFRIIAQSYSTETAKELCDDMKGKMKSILEGPDHSE